MSSERQRLESDTELQAAARRIWQDFKTGNGTEPEDSFNDDLEERNSDREDFQELAVWELRHLLAKAYDEGRKAGEAK
jgi:hypothetical protein